MEEITLKARAFVRGSFSASHVVEGHSTCGRLHGHDWAVEIGIAADISPKTGMVVDHGEVCAALESVCTELDNKDLNSMLPGVLTTPEGVASYIHERLILTFPMISAVKVSIGRFTSVVEWPTR